MNGRLWVFVCVLPGCLAGRYEVTSRDRIEAQRQPDGTCANVIQETRDYTYRSGDPTEFVNVASTPVPCPETTHTAPGQPRQTNSDVWRDQQRREADESRRMAELRAQIYRSRCETAADLQPRLISSGAIRQSAIPVPQFLIDTPTLSAVWSQITTHAIAERWQMGSGSTVTMVAYPWGVLATHAFCTTPASSVVILEDVDGDGTPDSEFAISRPWGWSPPGQ